MSKLWKVCPHDKQLAGELAKRLDIDIFAVLLAVSRGITDEDELRAFFDAGDGELCDPFLLPDMDKAVRRINEAIENFECIAVFGDYDADGITATAVLAMFLEMQGANFFTYIPDRHTEGYGLSVEAVEKLGEMGATLIVTVDNGISSIAEAARARELGIDLIVTDHHLPGETLPDCVAVVDAHRPDCTAPFRNYAGAGVAFKLVCALDAEAAEEFSQEFTQLAAIGTIADVVPLTGENRIIAARGIRAINEAPSIGLAALKNAAGVGEREIDSVSVSMALAPRLNAAGRMGSPERAYNLLISQDSEEAAALAAEIDDANIRRQKTELEVMTFALEQMDRHPERRYDRVIVCDGEGWFGGVIGIVASRMVEKYGKPCIIISRDGETAKGSGRSLDGFSLYDALDAVSDCLTSFGGHPLAAGVGLESSRIDEFRARINAYAAEREMPYLVQRIDMKLNPQYISEEILEAFSLLEPFGAGNPQPVLGLYGMRIDGITPVSANKHLRLTLSRGESSVTAMLFGCSSDAFRFAKGDTVDLAVTLYLNEYLGEKKTAVRIKNMKLSAMPEEELLGGERLFERAMRGELLDAGDTGAALPDRTFMGEVYKKIRAAGGWKTGSVSLLKELSLPAGDMCRLMVSLQALRELGLFESDSFFSGISMSPDQSRVDLDKSVLLSRLRESK